MATPLLKRLFCLASLVLLVISLVDADPIASSMTMEEYQKYDEKVIHINQDDFLKSKSQDTWLIFFGSNYCTHCRAATPHWLDLQDEYYDSLEAQGYHMRKIEFTKNNEIFNSEKIEWFPYFRIYNNGEKVQDFGDDKEVNKETLLAFIQDTFVKYRPSTSKLESKFKSTDVDLHKLIKQLTNYADEPVREHGQVNPEGKVEYLTSSTFPKLAPTIEALAPTLKKRVNIAKVDCTQDSSLCSLYGVRGYPTLKLQPYFTAIKSEEIGPLLSKNEVNFFYLYQSTAEPEKDPMIKKITQAWKSLRYAVPLYVSPDRRSFSELKLRLDHSMLVVVRDNGKTVLQYPDSILSSVSDQDIETWVHKHKYPLIQKLGSENSDAILGSGKLVVMAIVDPDHSTFSNAIEEMKQAARHISPELADKVVFAWLDGIQWSDYVSRVYGSSSHVTQFPSLILADATEDVFYDVDQDNIRFSLEHSSILSAIQNALDRRYKPKYTNGWFSSVIKSFGKTLQPLIMFVGHHPILFTLLGIAFILAFVYYITKDDQPEGFVRIKAEPKSN